MGLRILFTNNTLANRAGSEVYVRDAVLALKKRGHDPAAFSLALGEVAMELQNAGVEVVDDLRRLSRPPDIIHGQHHVETCIAATRFPAVPVVYFCHGVKPWEEIPPLLPTIRHYVAVDDAVYEFLTAACGIPADRVTRIYNFADLDRFKPRPALPPRPARALVFSNQASSSTHLPAIRQACLDSGISVDVAGSASGRRLSNPEEILGGYDLVFAKARAAIEAMATGCAVILCDATGAGPLVAPENVASLRLLNFGFRTLFSPLSPEHLRAQIALYRPEGAATVRDWIRSHAAMSAAIDRIEEVYSLAMRAHAAAPIVQPAEMVAAIADYLPLPGAKIKELLNAAASPPDSLPVAPPVIEIFANRGAGFNALDSAKQLLEMGAVRTIRFNDAALIDPRFPLRIDPVSVPAIIRIFSIRIFCIGDGTTLYSSSAADGFETLGFSADLFWTTRGDALEIISPGPDPVIFLPPFRNPDGGPCALEIVLSAEQLPAGLDARGGLLSMLSCSWNEQEKLAAGIRALQSEVDALRAQNTRLESLVQSAEAWQRSWFRRAFHRWRRTPRS